MVAQCLLEPLFCNTDNARCLSDTRQLAEGQIAGLLFTFGFFPLLSLARAQVQAQWMQPPLWTYDGRSCHWPSTIQILIR